MQALRTGLLGRAGRDRRAVITGIELEDALQATSEVDLAVIGRKSGRESPGQSVTPLSQRTWTVVEAGAAAYVAAGG